VPSTQSWSARQAAQPDHRLSQLASSESSPDPAITSESRHLTHGLTRARVGLSGLALGTGKGSGRLWPRMAAGKRSPRLPALRELGEGPVTTGPENPAAAGSWPAQGGPRRPRAGDRDAEERVRTRSADQGRARRASGPDAYRADLRRAGRAHRRHPGQPGRSQAGEPVRPGPPSAAGQGGNVGHGEVSPGPRPDQTQADVQAHKSRQCRRHVPARAGRAPRRVRPASGAV
jgi:hypothetical protein